MQLPDWLTSVDLWSALLGALVFALGTKYPIAVTIIQAIIERIRTPQPDKPAGPNSPVTVPPASPEHPLIDAAIDLIKRLARERFPWLPMEQAVVKYAAEELERKGELMAEIWSKRDPATPPAAPPT